MTVKPRTTKMTPMSYTILTADDDPTILKLMKQELEERGYRVIQATNGQAAMRMAESQKPDLIVLDVAMPVSTGISAFQAIRSLPATERIPVIFMTSVPSATIYPTVAQGSRVAHVKKPVDIEDLVSLIRQFLEKYPKET